MRASLGLLVAPLVPVAILTAWEPLALLLAAPWLLALVWVAVRNGLGLLTGEGEAEFPSAAEAAQRRLSVR
jgi:hypothetical protein